MVKLSHRVSTRLPTWCWNLDGTNPSNFVPVTIRVASDGTVTLVIGTSTITLGVVTVVAATGATGSN